MFSAKIFDETGLEYTDRLFIDGSNTLAEVFVHNINFIMDMMNGSPRMNERYGFSNISLPSEPDPRGIINTFLTMMYRFSQFKSGAVLQNNTELYTRLEELVKSNEKHTMIYKFIDILNNFKIPGISRIEAKCNSTENQIRLNKIMFPSDLIPSEYICNLTNEVMSLPTYDNRTPEKVLLDSTSYMKCIKEKGVNPYNRLPLTEAHLSVDETLKSKIDNFIKKAELAYQLYPTNCLPMYNKFHKEIVEDMPFNEFQLVIKPAPIKPLQKGFFNTHIDKSNKSFDKKEIKPVDAKSQPEVEEYTAILEKQQNTSLISEKTKLRFIAKVKDDYYVDATLDISKKTASEEKAIEDKLKSLYIPFVHHFFQDKKYIIIQNVNVAESVEKYISYLK